MQPADITGPNQILGETSPPRRRQKVRVRPGLRQAKPSTAPAPTTINTTTNTIKNIKPISSRRISVARFKPRKPENVKPKFGKITSDSSSVSEKRKVVGRHRMRRPPSIRSQQRPQRPSPVMKSIKRMRIRARERERSQERTTPTSSSSTARTPSTVGTTEIITISPDAHKIRFTLDSNEVTSELPILSRSPSGPSASKLVSTFLVPDDVFRQGVRL